MEEKVIKLLAEKFDAENITLETRVKEDLNADSLDVVELMMELEEEFNLTISDEDAMLLSTVGDIVSYINSKI